MQMTFRRALLICAAVATACAAPASADLVMRPPERVLFAPVAGSARAAGLAATAGGFLVIEAVGPGAGSEDLIGHLVDETAQPISTFPIADDQGFGVAGRGAAAVLSTGRLVVAWATSGHVWFRVAERR